MLKELCLPRLTVTELSCADQIREDTSPNSKDSQAQQLTNSVEQLLQSTPLTQSVTIHWSLQH